MAMKLLNAKRILKTAGVAVRVAPVALVGSWMGYAAATDPDRVPYDTSFVRTAASVVGTSLATWLSARRSKAALPVGLAAGAVSGALSLVQIAKRGTYVTSAWPKEAVRETVFNRATLPLHVGLGLLGLGSLLEDVPSAHSATRGVFQKVAAASPSLFEGVASAIPQVARDAWPQVRRLGLYYMVFSLAGHWAEMLLCVAMKHGIIKGGYDRSNHMLWDQWLFPFPAEGTAAVLMALFLYPAKQAIHGGLGSLAEDGRIHGAAVLPVALASTFLLNQAVCTSIDFTTGMVANRNYELWDYRDMRFNYKGQICLQNSLIYSIIATWAAWWLVPRMEAGLETAGPVRQDGAFVGLGSFYLFLLLLYHILPPGAGEMGTVWDDKV